ncbi:MAG: MotA/TolQ/ExbB proton channel family protein [Myxococcota bacterium]|nr:MotA/TolQ/ExbB proton channel family protein [Myxococcota bacterium]
MSHSSTGFVGTLMNLPLFQSEWVLWLLAGLSILSIAVVVERVWFYYRHKVDVRDIRSKLSGYLRTGDYQAAADYLSKFDSLETNVVLEGLKDHGMGAEAVQDLISGSAKVERSRYEKRLNFLATVASNAPFIGLFGTVLGIIRAFQDLSGNMAQASDAVMAGIAEALVATAVGLLVAIPAVVAFNVLKAKVGHMADNMHLLTSTLLAALKADGGLAPAPARISNPREA